MENKINIAEILKDCPKGMKLYSPLFGELKFGGLDSTKQHYPILIDADNSRAFTFDSNGRFYSTYPTAECLLFPSRELRDWTKFFKRGDVVYNKDGGLYAIFEGWVNDDYTEFNTTINYYESIASFGTEEVCYTDCFVKASDEERAVFIANAEKYYNGKYNPDTMRVEPAKPKCPFKPFEKVLVRNHEDLVWFANFFSHYINNNGYHYCCIDNSFRYCIPFNEQTARLVGTTDPYTEGGSE